MAEAVVIKDRDGRDHQITIDRFPDKCPICHRSVSVKMTVGAYNAGNGKAQLIFRCTAAQCDGFFVGYYQHNASAGGFELRSSAPSTPVKHEFPETVTEISSTFVEIHGQAMVAESMGLSQLVGIGLRKSLEFLIKDFACNQHPDQVENIRKVMLAPCIENYVTDIQIKETAKRAAWLGNDETHYIRKWEDRDIKDLKLLVRLTVNWIDNVLLTQKYIAEMSQGGPK